MMTRAQYREFVKSIMSGNVKTLYELHYEGAIGIVSLEINKYDDEESNPFSGIYTYYVIDWNGQVPDERRAYYRAENFRFSVSDILWAFSSIEDAVNGYNVGKDKNVTLEEVCSAMLLRILEK